MKDCGQQSSAGPACELGGELAILESVMKIRVGLRSQERWSSNLLTVTTNLVVDLVRAANHLSKLPMADRRRLLERSIAASSALRDLLVKNGKIFPIDASTEQVIDDIARNVELMSDETVAKALLTLADQIRTLGILNREPC
ncbi:hypothetical protein [Rhizobium sp. BK399]|uniref:hypothetical protein n=1 Tax=Rhizobium sp. BK399 TaxID=2587063 RepID=UPI00181327F9|nr:hypothetical protein [Rhizobium sp. BK399]MBB3543432.1 hypothetical protein [Rhizobium sp. BK399]